MPKFRKKPVIIEAEQFNGKNHDAIRAFCPTAIHPALTVDGSPPPITIPTLEGDHLASVGDYIIKGVNGEFYPCKPDIFEKTYEAVTE